MHPQSCMSTSGVDCKINHGASGKHNTRARAEVLTEDVAEPDFEAGQVIGNRIEDLQGGRATMYLQIHLKCNLHAAASDGSKTWIMLKHATRTETCLIGDEVAAASCRLERQRLLCDLHTCRELMDNVSEAQRTENMLLLSHSSLTEGFVHFNVWCAGRTGEASRMDKVSPVQDPATYI